MTSQPPPARPALFPARLRGRVWVVVAGFVGLAAIFYAPIVLGLRTYPDGDFTHHFLQPLDDSGDDSRRRENTRAAIEYCLRHPKWKLSLQTHKFIGIP